MKKYLFLFALTALAAISPNSAFAGATDLNSALGGRLCLITQAMTGNIGRGIATLGIVFLGIGAFFGKVNWGLAVMVGIGVAAIFGAASIMSTMGGNSAGCDTA